jgi:hypothetical protein
MTSLAGTNKATSTIANRMIMLWGTVSNFVHARRLGRGRVISLVDVPEFEDLRVDSVPTSIGGHQRAFRNSSYCIDAGLLLTCAIRRCGSLTGPSRAMQLARLCGTSGRCERCEMKVSEWRKSLDKPEGGWYMFTG